MPYLFPSGQSAETVVAKLAAAGWRGEIVGPHGTGKSSLLAALVPVLEQQGRRVLILTLHDRQRRLPVDLRSAGLDADSIVIVDGYEQLSWWNRWGLKRFCNRRRLGLLVTSHRATGLPTLLRTEMTGELARKVVAAMLGSQSALIAPAEIDAALARRHGNLREALFDLYDVYARRSERRNNLDES